MRWDRGKDKGNADTDDSLIRSTTFIVQKYIEMPLLIHSRKFDIRMWALVTHGLDGYLFKEGYLRTSSSAFTINLDDADNRYVHLTNNAVQRYGSDYGKFEDGNQLSFKQFQEYIDTAYPEQKIIISRDVLPQIKNQIKKSMLAVRKKLNSEGRKYSFEIFGYDFMIDTDFNVWLIEVNTNPCLEESSTLLKMLLPRMVDDALKLTLDSVFPPIPQYNNSSSKKSFPVTGYTDQESMWYA